MSEGTIVAFGPCKRCICAPPPFEAGVDVATNFKHHFQTGAPGFSPTVYIGAVVGTLAAASANQKYPFLVTVDGANNGLWERPGTAAPTRLLGYANPVSMRDLRILLREAELGPEFPTPLLTGRNIVTIWRAFSFTDFSSFANLFFDSTQNPGPYNRMFGRFVYKHEWRTSLNNFTADVNIDVGHGSYLSNYSWPKDTVIELVGIDPNTYRVTTWGASVSPNSTGGHFVAGTGWVASSGPADVIFRTDLAFPCWATIFAGEFCRDDSAPGAFTGDQKIFIALDAVNPATANPGGYNTAPHLDPTAWRRMTNYDRLIPWDSPGTATSSHERRKRYLSLTEETTVAVDGGDTYTAQRVWSYFDKWGNEDRDHCALRMSSYTPLPAITNSTAQDASFEFPNIPQSSTNPETETPPRLITTDSSETEWTMIWPVTFTPAAGGPRVKATITQRLSVETPFDDQELDDRVVSDTQQLSAPGHYRGMPPTLPPVISNPLAAYQCQSPTSSFGEMAFDRVVYGNHIKWWWCGEPQNNCALPVPPLQLSDRKIYLHPVIRFRYDDGQPAVEDGRYFMNCPTAGPVIFEQQVVPGNFTAYSYQFNGNISQILPCP